MPDTIMCSGGGGGGGSRLWSWLFEALMFAPAAPQDSPAPQDHFLHLLLLLGCLLTTVIFLATTCARRLRAANKIKAVKEFVAPGEGPRFRKRDRIAFISRRAIRNAKAVGSYIRGGQGRKRRDMAKLVKRVFHSRGSPDAQSQMLRPELPGDFLEEEGSGHDAAEWSEQSSLPEALVLVLRNLRVFGHFENNIFLEVMKKIEYVNLRKNEYLFSVGDRDEHMFIVEAGAIKVTYDSCTQEDLAMELKEVKAGEPIVSLLSFLDHLGGKRKSYKTVSARASQDNTRVIKFHFDGFMDAFDKYPESLVRVVQVVMVRLQRVTLLALHQYLGLGTELMNQRHRGASALNRQLHSGSPSDEEDDDGERAKMLLGPASSPLDASDEGNNCRIQEIALDEDSPFKSRRKMAQLSDDELKQLSTEAFKHYLGLKDDNNCVDGCQFLSDLEVTSCESGQVLVEEDTSDRNCLILVLTGCVQVSQRTSEKVSNEVYKCYPGAFLGQLQVLTSEPSFFTYTSVGESKVGVLSGASVRRCMKRHSCVALELAMAVIDHLSPYVRSIDFALEWMLVESGKALYKQDTKADSTYVILSGRLRSVISRGDGKREMVGEFGRGELTGIVETLMKAPRTTTVIAVRDTEVAKLPAGLLDLIKMRFPNVLMRLIKLLGEKLQQSWDSKGPQRYVGNLSSSQMQHAPQSNFSTVAVIGLGPELPVTPFTMELLHALNQIEPSIRLTKAYITQTLGPDSFEKSSDFRLSSWLAQQEDKHRIVLYQCDPELSAWTRLCVRHADVIFILANPESSCAVTALERSLETYARRTRKDMIFLHQEETKYPTDTALWLRERGWINSHYHVRCPKRMYFKKRSEKVEAMYKRVLSGPAPDVHSDFSRLARGVTGNSIGLVLGGGGARGCSHVGMIRAILDAGIPIDTVAGVSIGSFIGALWCQERNVTELTVKARTFSHKMTPGWRNLFDLTWPIVSYFSGHRFNVLIEEVFGNKDIRDLWLPFFTITTDLTDSAMRIHDYGSLWRYVRSSMSLAGYMPPLCDPHDGHLLLDGGYVNNLPADIMRMRGAKHVLAIDVGAQNDIDFTNYGDFLSGVQVLLSRMSPFRTRINVPNQTDIQSRLAYVSCVPKLEAVKFADYCDYIRPPIDQYDTLQFSAFDEIKDVGYYHGKTYFAGLMKAGLLRQMSNSKKSKSFEEVDEETDEEVGEIYPVGWRRPSGAVIPVITC